VSVLSSELAPPTPFPASHCVPPNWILGVGTHSLAGRTLYTLRYNYFIAFFLSNNFDFLFDTLYGSK
jgi:hypothetical protein